MSKNKLPVLDEKSFEDVKYLDPDHFAGAGKMIRLRRGISLAFFLKNP